jgi:hypothetical protein
VKGAFLFQVRVQQFTDASIFVCPFSFVVYPCHRQGCKMVKCKLNCAADILPWMNLSAVSLLVSGEEKKVPNIMDISTNCQVGSLSSRWWL